MGGCGEMRLFQVVALLVLSVSVQDIYAKRVALLIGNANYQYENKLRNPINDAVLLQSVFKNDLKFDEVRLVKNADIRSLNRAVDEFGSLAQGADVAVVYFSGHGQQDDRQQNYLLATDAKIERSLDLRTGAVTSDDLVNATAGAKARVVILDACRDRPNGGFKSATKGLARSSISEDELLIAYATQAGKVADDGRGNNSPYAQALAKAMRQKDLPILDIFDNVKTAVLAETKGQQSPTRQGDLKASVYFINPTINVNHNATPIQQNAEFIFWESIKNDTSTTGFQAYLKKYPNGHFVELAEARIQQYSSRKSNLTTSQPQVTAQTSTNDATEMYNRAKQYSANLDYQQAMNWYRQAADLDNRQAMYAIGSLYTNGWGVAKDQVEAQKWYQKSFELVQKAAYSGDTKAMVALGVWYAQGQGGIKKDYGQAMQWYQKAADLDNTDAMYGLGNLYIDGLGVKKDYSQAMQWHQKAADLGGKGSMTEIGLMYEHGHGVKKDINQAIQWYQKAADLGDALAMRFLGHMYFIGKDVKKDINQAIQWYEKSANTDNDVAMMMIVANIYFSGVVVTKNDVKAFEWYKKAADLGDANGMLNVAAAYQHGYGVPKNLAEAQKWYLKSFEWHRKAADLGVVSSMSMLSFLYTNGFGVAQDLTEARKWSQKAIAANK